MDDPVPIMVDISASDKLIALYPYTNQRYAIAFVVNGANINKALDFFTYLLN